MTKAKPFAIEGMEAFKRVKGQRGSTSMPDDLDHSSEMQWKSDSLVVPGREKAAYRGKRRSR